MSTLLDRTSQDNSLPAPLNHRRGECSEKMASLVGSLLCRAPLYLGIGPQIPSYSSEFEARLYGLPWTMLPRTITSLHSSSRKMSLWNHLPTYCHCYFSLVQQLTEILCHVRKKGESRETGTPVGHFPVEKIYIKGERMTFWKTGLRFWRFFCQVALRSNQPKIKFKYLPSWLCDPKQGISLSGE